MNPAITTRQRKWKKCVEDCLSSGLSQADYWQLTPHKSGTKGVIELHMTFDLPVPKMFMSMAQEVIGTQVRAQLEGYTAALQQTLGALPE